MTELRACGGRFTLRRPLSAKELTACPACRRPIRKVITGFSTLLTKPLSISDAKKAGFTVPEAVNRASTNASNSPESRLPSKPHRGPCCPHHGHVGIPSTPRLVRRRADFVG